MTPEQVEETYSEIRSKAEELVLSDGLEVGLDYFEKECHQAGYCGRPIEKAYFHRVISSFYFRHERYEETIKESDISAELYGGLNLPIEVAKSSVIKIYVLSNLLRHDEAIELGETLLPLFSDLPAGQIIVKNHLSHVNWSIGEYEKSLDGQRSILADHRNHMPPASVADFKLNIAWQLSSLDRFSDALNNILDLRAFMAGVNEDEFSSLFFNRVGINHASILLKLGRFEDALKIISDTRNSHKIVTPADIGYLEMIEATLRSYLGEHELATYHYKTAQASLVNPLEVIENGLLFCRHLRTLDNSESRLIAFDLAKETLIELEKIPNKNFVLTAKIELGEILLSLDRKLDALSAAEEGLRIQFESPRPIQTHHLKLIKADAIAHLNPQEAIDLYVSVKDMKGLPSELIIRAAIGMGTCYIREKRFIEAKQAFKKAIDLIENWKASVAGHAQQASFLERAKEPIAGYLSAQVELHTTPETLFAFLENIQHITISEIRDSSPIFERVENQKLQELYSKRESFLRQLDMISRPTVGARNEWEILLPNNDIEKLNQLRSKILQLEEEIRREMPTAEFGNHDLPVQAYTGEDCSQYGVLTWFETVESLNLLVKVNEKYHTIGLPKSMDEISADWNQLFRQFGRRRKGGPADKRSAALWQDLIGPARHLIAKVKKLIILPIGPLWQIPFAGLIDEKTGRYIAERWTISVSPSMRLWQMCQQRAPEGKNVLLVGAAGDQTADDFLPHVAGEIQQLNQLFPDAIVLQSESANREGLNQNLANNQLIHFAGHIEFDTKRPMMSGIRLHNNRYYRATDFYLRPGVLQGAKVVLSGCESARVAHAGPEMVGLTSALVAAGASSILASLWPVDDQATAVLMQVYYQFLQDGLQPAEALRKAQNSLRQSDQFSHPVDWAGWMSLLS